MDDGAALAALAARSPITVCPPTHTDGRQSTVEAGGEDITWEVRRPEVDANVSNLARHPAVRAALIDQQRRGAVDGRVVMVGRDIGTVVLPHAPLKIFLVASLEVRARRRYDEMIARGQPANYESILADMRRRDEIDSLRAVAPLKPAADAVTVDTTGMRIDEVVNHIVALAVATPPRPGSAAAEAQAE